MRKTVDIKCLAPYCKDFAGVRGVCRACYAAVYYYVRKGKITDDELVAQGKLLPRKPNPVHERREWIIGNDNEKV